MDAVPGSHILSFSFHLVQNKGARAQNINTGAALEAGSILEPQCDHDFNALAHFRVDFAGTHDAQVTRI